ncbi:unnamed protein product [Brassica rapa subsp. trilocularis]
MVWRDGIEHNQNYSREEELKRQASSFGVTKKVLQVFHSLLLFFDFY